MKIVIVGAGLGGLTLAHLLKSKGVSDVEIYERDEDKIGRNQGYFIGIDSDVLNILRQIPDNEDLQEVVTPNPDKTEMAIVDSNFDRLLSFHGDTMLVSRWALRSALTNNINVHWNKKFDRYEERDGKVFVYFEDGEVAVADLLIAADGSRSKIRAQRCPTVDYSPTTYQNTTGTVVFPEKEYFQEQMPKLYGMINAALIRCFGENSHSLLMFAYECEKTRQRGIMWSLSWDTEHVQYTAPELESPECIAAIARKNFKTDEFEKLVRLPEGDTKFSPGIVHTSTKRQDNPFLYQDEHKKRKTTLVTLLGDAAHPMTTHRGQGANTAIRDAVDLSDTIVGVDPEHFDSQEAQIELEKYEEKMFKRGFKMVGESMSSTQMIHWVGWRAWSRNWALWTISKVLSFCGLFSRFRK